MLPTMKFGIIWTRKHSRIPHDAGVDVATLNTEKNKGFVK